MTPPGDVFEPGGSELEELIGAQKRQRQLFEEMARRLRAAKVVVKAARELVAYTRGAPGGSPRALAWHALKDAVQEFDK